jgi:hypothetical protein
MATPTALTMPKTMPMISSAERPWWPLDEDEDEELVGPLTTVVRRRRFGGGIVSFYRGRFQAFSGVVTSTAFLDQTG